MYFSDEVILRSMAYGEDADGYTTETPTNTTVFANIKSAARTEFYAANANKIDVSCIFEVHVEDYSDQQEVEYNSKSYDVIRTYQKGLGSIELVCSDKAV